MAEKGKTQGLTVKKENFNEWYEQVVLKAQIADKRLENSRGFYGYPPWGTMIFRNMEKLYESELLKTKHFPIRTPTTMSVSLLEKEKAHAQGFAPEVWKITSGHGGVKLDIPKVLRPTGEAVMYPYFKYWIENYKDLPFKIFETRPTFRAEPGNAVIPLLRSHEFYWIEAHTAQVDNEHADAQVREDMVIFDKITWDLFALPFVLLRRPEWDKFAGADYTCAYDSPFPDGKVSQIGTTHNLGKNFAEAFEVTYRNEDNVKKYCYQTSFGMGNGKMLGTLIAIHGDDKGIILPPALAPIQFVIVPIFKKGEKNNVMRAAKKLRDDLEKEGIRVRFDDRDDYTPGWKFNEWELKGVPIRIEIGPKDLEKKSVMVVKRYNGEKKGVKISDFAKGAQKLLDNVLKGMKENAKGLLKIDKAKTFDELVEKNDKGIHLIEVAFCNSNECVIKLKDKSIKVRGVRLFANNEKSVKECMDNSMKASKGKKCAVCSGNAEQIVMAARQY